MKRTGSSGSRAIFGLLLIMCFSFFLPQGCIERSNPWDPVNGCHPEAELLKYRDDYTDSISNYTSRFPLYADQLFNYWKDYHTIQNANDTILINNNTILEVIRPLLESNRRIRKSFSNDSCEVIDQCTILTRKPTLLQQHKEHPVQALLKELTDDSTEVHRLIYETQLLCPKKAVLSEDTVTSVTHSYSTHAARIDTLLDTIQKTKQLIETKNLSIASIRMEIEDDSIASFKHNEELAFCQLKKQNHPDTILKAIENLLGGDTIGFDTSEITFIGNDIRFTDIDGSTNTIYVLGKPENRTRIHAPYIEIQNSTGITFRNIIFSETGRETKPGSGVRITTGSSRITFNNCIFEYNAQYGLECLNSDSITLQNCILHHNGRSTNDSLDNQGGMRADDCRQIILSNVLVVHNTGYGIDVNRSPVTLYTSTICNNTIDGIQHRGENATGYLYCYSSIIAFNHRYGIFREPITGVISARIFSTNRFYENGAADFIGGDADSAASTIIVADPQFTDTTSDHFNYRVGADSFAGIGYQYPQ